MEIIQYIQPEMLILIPILWVVGKALKSTPKIPDWKIPYILAVIGVFGAGLWAYMTEGATASALFTAFTQGILATGVSVWGNQLVRQAGKRDDGKGD